MGVRERKREKEKAKESTKPVEQEQVESTPVIEDVAVEEEAHTPEVVVEITEAVESETQTEVETEPVTEIVVTEPDFVMPSWGDVEETEWMYGIPTREDDRELWAGEWSDYLLIWAEERSVHILSLATIISEPPFKDLRNKVDSFKAFLSQRWVERLPRDKQILAVCAKGDTSEFVAQALRGLEFEAFNLAGGTQAWGDHYAVRPVVETEELTVLQVSRPARGCLSYVVASGDRVVVIDPLRHVDHYLDLAREQALERIAAPWTPPLH